MVDGASLIEAFLADLDALGDAEAEEVMTIAQAAARSGYSTDHLSRLIREGKLANYGRKGAPRIRHADLPVRPGGHIARIPDRAYDPNTDARSLRVRR